MQQDEDDWEMPDPTELSDPEGEATPDAGDVGAAAEILKDKRDELMQRPGVTMVGETIDAAGRSAIMIGVRTASDLHTLPKSVGGVPVVGTVTGDVDALHRPEDDD